jgi:ABC-type bacteriocin/lantibiotic exporter with double-glycine peptidase domain
MDCGPASLKCLLEGFGIHVSYGRLREACQTDLDGTSIDTLEEVAGRLGLDAGQTMLPADHLHLAESAALPALVVTRVPGGMTHFLVVWRRHGPVVQVMDPAVGRRWLSPGRLLAELYRHRFPVSAAGWREWAATDQFLGPLRRRLAGLGVECGTAEGLVEAAARDTQWRSLAELDAAIRLAAAVVRPGGVRRGREAAALVARLCRQAALDQSAIPLGYWSAAPTTDGPAGEPQVMLQGAVLVQVRSRRPVGRDEPPLSPELVAALTEPPVQPARELWRLVRQSGLVTPALVAVAACAAAAGVVGEALLFRGLLNGAGLLGPLIGLGALLLLVEVLLTGSALAAGRGLEAHLRTALWAKLPRLPDRYLRSRPISDMAERSHSIHQLRLLPDLASDLLRNAFHLVLIGGGIAWLDPVAAPLALVAAAFTLALSLGVQVPLRERDLRLRSHIGAMGRFYLDGLLGLLAIRAHAGESAVEREHDGLLESWSAAARALYRAVVTAEAAQTLAGFGLAILIVLGPRPAGFRPADLLLLLYWALSLPVLGQAIGLLARQYPIHRNLTLRFLEPLQSPEEETGPAPKPAQPRGAGVAVAMEGVSVIAGGRPVLEDVSLEIEPGAHVVLVGQSGSGKSTLAGLLLGWQRPAAGRLFVDGKPLGPAELGRLRQDTAWVDSDVQLWNRPMRDNLLYGAEPSPRRRLEEAIVAAELQEVIRRLPDGLDGRLGEGGGLLSGGEGQRVRLARALLRSGVRLVVLDEPFRGLDRARRKELLARARRWWRPATLLCITHDLDDAMDFDRVLVLEKGRLVEDGDPETLAARPGSRFAAMRQAEQEVRSLLGDGGAWRRLWLEDGRLTERLSTRNAR